MIKIKNGEYEYDTYYELGSGSLGKIYHCRRTKDGKELAVKMIKKDFIRKHKDYGLLLLEKEIIIRKIATKSGLPFFVRLYDSFSDGIYIYMILEKCEMSMHDFVNKRELSEDHCLEMIFQIGLGLKYLYSIDASYRNIKTQNILIKDGILKITDFECATKSCIKTSELKPNLYMAPELFKDSEQPYTSKIDVWALNTCLYYFLTKNYYFNKKIPAELKKQVFTKTFELDKKYKFSKELKDLLKCGYEKKPEKRLSISEYLGHPVFKKFKEKYNVYINISMTGIGNRNNQFQNH